MRITERINYGVTLEEVLDFLFEEMRPVIPYNRIGCALIEQQPGTVVSRWARSDRPVSLKPGYRGRLEGSTLERIIQTMRPRIINDLQAYLRQKPQSQATKLIVSEGLQSSLTCPLIVQGKAVGFVFFTSADKDTYSNVHVEFFQQIAGQLATIVEKGRLHNELAEQKEIIQEQNLVLTRELEMARHVQRALIPDAVPKILGLDIAFAYEPAIQVGGDILDIIPLRSGQVRLFVADAMGHGVQAALVMSVVKAALYPAVEQDPRPASVLASVNNVVARLFSDRFVTAACCLVDPTGRDAEIALAGHAGPLWFRVEEEDVSQQNVPSLPLGIAKDNSYETAPIQARTGDVLVFSTDGIEEAFDSRGNQYGGQRFRSQVLRYGRESAHELCVGVRHDLDAHCKDRIREDDLSLLVVKFSGIQSGEGQVE